MFLDSGHGKYLGLLVCLSIVFWAAGCTSAPPIAISSPTTLPNDASVLNKLGATEVSPKDHSIMVYVPAGQFPMGSEVGLTDEQPVHTVYLDAFWLDRTEVTNAMYRKCVEAGKCKLPDSLIYYNDPLFADHPVTYVSWVNAVDYCSFVGRRLPTEAEWEKAAIWDPVNNKKLVYPWGDTYDCSKANFDDETKLDASLMQDGSVHCDGYDLTAPVGSFPQGASPYGAWDMAGNVWEWVHDAFVEVDPLTSTIVNYYAISPTANPQGVDPAMSEYRVMRGGSWNWTFGYGRSAYRLWYGKDDRYDAVGFRCAVSE